MAITRQDRTFLTTEELKEAIGLDPAELSWHVSPVFFYRGLAVDPENNKNPDPVFRREFFVEGFFWGASANVLNALGGQRRGLSAQPCAALVDGQFLLFESQCPFDGPIPPTLTLTLPASGPLYYWEDQAREAANALKIPWQHSAPPDASENIDPRERATLLRIIKTLALAQGLTLDVPHSAADQVAALAAQYKVGKLPANKTIAAKLLDARNVE